MKTVRLARKGADHLRKVIERQLVDREYTTRTDLPWSVDWSSVDEYQYFTSLPTYRGRGFTIGQPTVKQHFRSGSLDNSITLTPDFSATELDFSVLDVLAGEEYQVLIECKDSRGEILEETTWHRRNSGFANDRKDDLSFDIPEGTEEITIELDPVKRSTNRVSKRIAGSKEQWPAEPGPYLTHPAVRREDGTPIFIFSIDTFRYDHLVHFEPLLETLGEDAVVPEEPRTQGYWTRPAHGSLFTGVHPADHGYVSAHHQGDLLTLSPSLRTLPEVLAEHGYKNSSCIIREKLGPKFGFGKGFHRGLYHPVSWDDREFDVSDIVSTLTDWVRADTDGDSEALFYFTHIFDAHSPYVPPSWLLSRSDISLDFTVPEAFVDLNRNTDYLTTLRTDQPEFPSDDLELVKEYYRLSLKYVATRLVDFINTLRDVGLYEKSLLIFIGDHGEDFLERNFSGHSSLTDYNIRPGTIVKPPANADLSIPDEIDNIDIFPTICELLDIAVPKQCQGQAWQSHEQQPRITERISDDSYNISVESDSYKAIFTFGDEFPTRPRPETIDDDPINTETYEIELLRAGNDSRQHPIPDDVEQRLLEVAKEFVIEHGPGNTDMETVTVEEDVKKQLEQLGYK